MNIFAYSPDPYESALWLDDVRKNKMILESFQLLSTSIHKLLPPLGPYVYKQSYVNHPCAIWARASHTNFRWLLEYTTHLFKQRNKPHKSARLFPMMNKFCDECSDLFPRKNLTPFVNCARNQSLGVDFTHINDVHSAYRLYTNERWRRDTIKLSWNYGQEPEWRNK